jgi:S-adenosylmethionine synthetase
MSIHVAEDILPGHPDRLADAIAERIVDHAVANDPDAIAAIEAAVHREQVFVTGLIRIDSHHTPHRQPDQLVADALTAAGYTGRWRYQPRVTSDLVVEELGGPTAREARRVSEDQNIVVGHATGSEATNHLPPAVHTARYLRHTLAALQRQHTDQLGPDGKLFVRLREHSEGTYAWERISVSLQHAPGPIDYHALEALVLPALEHAARDLDQSLQGLDESWHPTLVRLNGAGDFSRGGPFADNGLTGKKLVVDHYGPGVPIGGGALAGKDPYKVDRAGALAARHLAVQLHTHVDAGQTTVYLGWLPGQPTPDTFFAIADDTTYDERRIRSVIPISDLSLEAIVNRYELTTVNWHDTLNAGYVGAGHQWDRGVEPTGTPRRSRDVTRSVSAVAEAV